jgi:hypothetical protein
VFSFFPMSCQLLVWSGSLGTAIYLIAVCRGSQVFCQFTGQTKPLLGLRFSRLEFSVWFRLSGMNGVECWKKKLSSVSANIKVAIFRVNVYWLDAFWKTYRTGSRWRVGCDESDWLRERAGCYPIVSSMWLMKTVLVTVWIGKGVERILEATWLGEEVIRFFNFYEWATKMETAVFAETLDNFHHSGVEPRSSSPYLCRCIDSCTILQVAEDAADRPEKCVEKNLRSWPERVTPREPGVITRCTMNNERDGSLFGWRCVCKEWSCKNFERLRGVAKCEVEVSVLIIWYKMLEHLGE